MSAIGPEQSSPAVDIVQQINGNFGRWQLRTILLIFLCKIPSAWFMACVIYTAPTPQKGDYYCKPPSRFNVSENNGMESVTIPAWVRMSHPFFDERGTDRRFYVGPCNIYEEQLENNFAEHYGEFTNPFKQPPEVPYEQNKSHDASPQKIRYKVNVIPCEHFEHNSEYNSLVTQFDLVCSRQLLVSVTQSFHALGAVFGGLLCYKALKHISPHRLMLIGMWGQIFFGCLTGFVNSFQLHVYFRCLTSLFCVLMYTSGQVIFTDITAGRARTIVITLFELFWGIGLVLLPGISIFLDSWSYLYVTISASVIVLVFLHRWIADSPRWLLRRRKIDRALQLLLESAALNNRHIPLNLESQLRSYAKQLRATPRFFNFWAIWDGRTPRKYIMAIHWAWAGAALLYNVMLILIRSLSSNGAAGFAEMLGVFLGLFFILYTRRRWLWAGNIMLVAGAFTYLIWLVPSSMKSSRYVAFEMIFWIFLKFANAASLSVLTTCTGELVTTDKSLLLMLSVSTFSRILVVIGPFISITTSVHKFIPITVFATLAVFNGVLMCTLNRTFWDRDQPRAQKALTPSTYRRNSAIALIHRRASMNCELNGGLMNPTYHDNSFTISISDLWQLSPDYQSTAGQNASVPTCQAANIETMQKTTYL